MKMRLFGPALAFVALTAVASAPAQADVRTGLLECSVAPSVGYVVGSQKDLACTFSLESGRRERYAGHLTTVGLDVGFSNGGTFSWAVYAATMPGRGALGGSYSGASASATVAVGLGANLLVGGSDNAITLQPLSVSTQTGLNAAVGIQGLQLSAVGREHRGHRRHHRHHRSHHAH